LRIKFLALTQLEAPYFTKYKFTYLLSSPQPFDEKILIDCNTSDFNIGIEADTVSAILFEYQDPY